MSASPFVEAGTASGNRHCPGGEMLILGRSGSERVRWRMDSPDEIGVARNAFDSLRRKGHCAFTCASTGAKRRVREFSPGLTALLIVPGIIGAENDATGNCLGV